MKPLNNKIQLEINELKFGAVQSESIAEQGKIIDFGPNAFIDCRDMPPVKMIGKTLYFKAWAVDVITDTDNKKYYFISADSDAICAISD